jgi:superfamily II DNA or RNA helicase
MAHPKTRTQHREQLARAYRMLTALQKQIVQLLSVVYKPAFPGEIVQCLNALKVHDDHNRRFTQKTLIPLLEDVVSKDLLAVASVVPFYGRQQGNRYYCNRHFVELATRLAVEEGHFEAFVDTIEKTIPITTTWDDRRIFATRDALIREVRIGIYRRDMAFIDRQFDDLRHNNHPEDLSISPERIYRMVFDNPFDPSWFSGLPAELFEQTLSAILEESLVQLEPAMEPFKSLNSYRVEHKPVDVERVNAALALQWLLKGNLAAARPLIESGDSVKLTALAGWWRFLSGDTEQALAVYRTALKRLRKQVHKRRCFFESVDGLFFILALMSTEDALLIREAIEYMQMVEAPWLASIYRFLTWAAEIQLGDVSRLDASEIAHFDPDEEHPLTVFFQAMVLFWMDRDRLRQGDTGHLEQWRLHAEQCGFSWLAAEMGELLNRLLPNRARLGEQAAAFREQHGLRHSLVDLLQPKAPWERTLKALTDVDRLYQTDHHEAKHRLAWLLTADDDSHTGYVLEAREQRMSHSGSWNKGRALSLKRLAEKASEMPYLTEQDLKMTTHIRQEAETRRFYLEPAAWLTLVGHPLVVWADRPDVRVELVEGNPELRIDKSKGERIGIRFSPKLYEAQSVALIQESPTRLRVIGITDAHRYLHSILGSQGITVPGSAKSQLLSSVGAVSSLVTVHSGVGGEFGAVEQVNVDDRPYIHLSPRSDGLRVEILVCPFYPPGPYYSPGAGGQAVIAEIQGKRMQAQRDLEQEKKRADAVIEACPILNEHETVDGSWELDDPEACLELLLELQALGDQVVVEWPKGKKFEVTGEATPGQFRLRITRDHDWFDIDGSLQVKDDLVLDMRRLLALMDHAKGRFVQLDDGRFLALTHAFRKSMGDLRAYSETHGQGLRIHPLAAPALDDLTGEVGELIADKAWEEQKERLHDAQALQPELPSTLQAELRDYQKDGFEWLARLAHWGVGACLADDMGLGKTLQALALLLTRAPDGATLVVAPTSVCTNWISEVDRFAPTLNVIAFGGGDRQKILDNLKPFDLMVCSYGLLQQTRVAEMLAGVHWNMIILDEAQAIKNKNTRRSQAAMALQGDFKLITTGTPIENHLGELWNLFRFINPGLLGSEKQFHEKFAGPIERSNDVAVRRQLKRLVQPFILRRTKTQVLDELPPRTEIVLHVELSEEERRLYESLRQNAVQHLAGIEGPGSGKHLRILAELMKLRRACCNPALVMRDTTIPSSKLAVFGDVLEELLDNKHKALVFSQFVDHLQLIRNQLERKGIRYQYLDGKTPAKERKKRIDAFQAGDGDLFLISLKAGGVGLNLTAADYVIHMDPWWNPATEDQASDRAHRIGQQRPVTIYRLVCKQTIEEKILDLHQHKRDLADSLLEGTDMAGKMSADDLLRLISEPT